MREEVLSATQEAGERVSCPGRLDEAGARGSLPMVAALYVLPDGPYAGLAGVDLWPESRDARLYRGPWPVVAHPPCARWGRYWFGGPSARVRRILGDDGGCFAAALDAVRQWGGVLEHPEGSHAFRAFGLRHPSRWGGWEPNVGGGWVCCVEQGHYGHAARKATWLYAVSRHKPADLIWGVATQCMSFDDDFRSDAERDRAIRTGRCQRLSRRQRQATPAAFRDVLLEIARKTLTAPMGGVDSELPGHSSARTGLGYLCVRGSGCQKVNR